MSNEHQIVKLVYDAKYNMQKADELIEQYIPFIRAEASKTIGKICTEADDEMSIAMIAFHEAIQGYKKESGAFLPFASLVIKSRLMDFGRSELRHIGHVSIYEEHGEDETTLYDKLADTKDYYIESENLEATKHEIEELKSVMKTFDVTLTDVADNSPKQERTLIACGKVVRFAASNKELLDELLRTKKLPISQLSAGAEVEKKTIERHRKYILVMLLIQTNGYEIIRGHIKRVLKIEGGAAV